MTKLTRQEQRILELIIKQPQMTAPQIAQQLKLKRSEVSASFLEIYRKLRVNSRESILQNVATYSIGDQKA